MDLKLYTIGYEGAGLDEFLSRLMANDVDVVIDVRQLPLSRKKGFSKTSLKQSLQAKNIDYQNFQELGADKKLRDRLKKTLDYQTFFAEMKSSISRHKDLISRINSLIMAGQVVALMCFEKDSSRCHRKVVADFVQKANGNGLEIEHLSIL